MFLESKGYVFESETDTECIAKLVKHIRSQNPSYTFRQLVEQTISQVRVLGAVHILHNTNLGSRETPPHCNIVINWADQGA